MVKWICCFRTGDNMARAIGTSLSRKSFYPLITSAPNFIPRTLIAIPCYNEELTIGSIVLKAKKYSDDILVIDDGSKDATTEIAEKAGAVVIRHPENRGKAASVLTAIQYAKNLNFDALVLLDGDGQHRVDEIPTLINPILKDDYDLVIGSRFLPCEGTNCVPTHRRIGQITLDLVSNATCNYKSTDSQSGFRALSRQALMRLDIVSEGYNIETDMIRHLADEGLSITEVPISVRYDTPNGHKKSTFSHGFDILSHIVGLISYRRPMLAFGIPGFISTTFGLLLSIYSLSVFYSSGIFHYVLFLISIIALIFGLLFIVAAFIMNSIAHIIRSQKLTE
jgi:glycosyltransferase involved in cell wall biosynthesis